MKMTDEEAIRHLENHMRVHKMKEHNAILITEAHEMAIKALKENEELKRLLKLTVQEMDYLGMKVINFKFCDYDNNCDECPMDLSTNCTRWKHKSEVMSLIGDDGA